MLAAVAGGLRDLLPTHGEPVGDLVLRASVPVSLRQEQAGRLLGNQVGWMAVPLPVGEPCHARRLALIAAATAERKKNARPRKSAGSRWRKLNPGQQALLVLAYLRGAG